MKRIGLILVVLVVGIFLSGCCCCGGYITPPVQNCSLTVTAGYWVWGEVWLNGEPTGVQIDYSIPSMKTVVLNVPCNQTVEVKIVDACGYQSHTETIFIACGQNYLSFNYW